MAQEGRSWFERRQAQAAAARKVVNRARSLKRPGKADRSAWKREVRRGR